ncbi:MAG TPA: hypothetical protein VHL79_16410 [Ramlibacter sp.]|nr:hypothetical protein [Ramlibacter sp.]
MNRKIAALVLAGSLLGAPAAQAQSEASALSALSMLPVASVVGAASAAAVVLPVALSTAGSVLVVKTVESTARGTVLVLERASDGARASVELTGRAVAGTSLVAGTLVTVSVIGAGVLLSAAGEVIAFVPNAIGQALLANERITR